MASIIDIKETLIAGDIPGLVEKVQSAVDQGFPAKMVLGDGLIAGMDVVGERMESGDMFIPEVLRCAKAMSRAVAILTPHLAVEDSNAAGKVVIGTVKGDLHDIGKNLVRMMLASAGFEIIDLGVDIAQETFVESIKEHKPQILGLSALLTTTMPAMENTVKAIRDTGIDVKTIVGGAPVTQDFADQIGADGYASDAGSAVKMVKNMIKNL